MIHLRNLPLPCPINRMYRAMPMTVGAKFIGGRKIGGRTISMQVLSKQARLRRDALVAEIWRQLGGRPVAMTGPVQIAYTITPRDRRTPDVDAYEKHLLDCLAKAGVYANDKQVVQTSKERLEPQHPGHLDVQIWEVSDGSSE